MHVKVVLLSYVIRLTLNATHLVYVKQSSKLPYDTGELMCTKKKNTINTTSQSKEQRVPQHLALECNTAVFAQ